MKAYFHFTLAQHYINRKLERIKIHILNAFKVMYHIIFHYTFFKRLHLLSGTRNLLIARS